MEQGGQSGCGGTGATTGVPICRRCGPTRAAWANRSLLKLRCSRCGGRILGLSYAPAAVIIAAATAAGARKSIAVARTKGPLNAQVNGWPGLHLVKLAPAEVPPVLWLTALLDADAAVCEVVMEPAPGADTFIAGEAAARLGLKGDRVTHVRQNDGGRRHELAPLLRRIPATLRAASELWALMTTPPLSPPAGHSTEWGEGYAAAMDDLCASREFHEFGSRLSEARRLVHLVPEFIMNTLPSPASSPSPRGAS